MGHMRCSFFVTLSLATLLVDIIDGKSFKLLNRAYGTRPVLRDPSPQVRAERISEAVDAVLKDVKIA